jgi:hypothetical protein
MTMTSINRRVIWVENVFGQKLRQIFWLASNYGILADEFVQFSKKRSNQGIHTEGDQHS